MNIKIQGGGGGTYANTGSSIAVTNYLEHEELDRVNNGQEREHFFTHDKEQVSAREATYKIDNNKAQLMKKDSKFFVITVSPSEKEVKAMGIETDIPKIVNPDVDLEIGDTVEVAKGPFAGQVGNVEEINLESKEAKVCIDAFGKKTLFVIEFENIQKI